MKYYKRLKLYKASNVTFDPATCRAYSYDWWRFVDRVDGKVVFNNHRYSNSTAKHQSKVHGLLRELGIKIDLYVDCPTGLQREFAANSAMSKACTDFGKMLLNNKYARKPLSTMLMRKRIRAIKKLWNEPINFARIRGGVNEASIDRDYRLKRAKQLREERKASKQPTPAETPNLASYSNVVPLFG